MVEFFKYKEVEIWKVKNYEGVTQYEIKCSFIHDGFHYFNPRKYTWKEVTDFIDQHSNH